MKAKSFDCVAMKNAIQAKRLVEWEGLPDEEIRQRIRQRLATSDDPVAVWWRRIGEAEAERNARSSGGSTQSAQETSAKA